MAVILREEPAGPVFYPACVILNYIAFFFLTWVILLCLTPLLFFLINLPDHSGRFIAEFFGFFSFLNPKFGEPSLSINQDDIMLIFSVISLVFSVPFTVLKLFLREKFKKEVRPSFKQRLKAHIAVLAFFSVLGIVSVSVMAFQEAKDPTFFYLIFAGFFVVAVFMDFLYLVFSRLADSPESCQEEGLIN